MSNSENLFQDKNSLSNIKNLNNENKNIPVEDTKKQNIINLFGSEFVDIKNDFIEKPEITFFDDVCSICSSPIYYKKFMGRQRKNFRYFKI